MVDYDKLCAFSGKQARSLTKFDQSCICGTVNITGLVARYVVYVMFIITVETQNDHQGTIFDLTVLIPVKNRFNTY